MATVPPFIELDMLQFGIVFHGHFFFISISSNVSLELWLRIFFLSVIRLYKLIYLYICRWYKGNVKINTDDIVSVQKFYKYSKLAAQTNNKRSLTRSNKQMENLLASVQSSSMEENHMDLVGAVMQKTYFLPFSYTILQCKKYVYIFSVHAEKS